MPVFMPVFVKISEWQQTLTKINFKLPSYGTPANKIDFLFHDVYIKIHYQQFICELFLWKSIDVSKSTCVVTDSDIIFELTKSIEENWDKLEADLDKSAKKELREEIILHSQQRSEEEKKLKITKNAELKRIAVREQIALDTKRHEKIDQIKKTETEKALKEFQLWEKQNEKVNKNVIEKKEFVKPNNQFKKSNDPSKYKSSIKKKAIIESTPPTVSPAIPLPRKAQTFNVSFTTREFPTPTRESKAHEEEEWLAKQAAARRSAGFDSKDLRPEERNPQWLKAKGDEFFKVKNYLGAISAYSEGIRINKNFVDLYVNRSAAHFAVNNLQRTIEDCSKALEIMTPPVPATLKMRIQCIARRGAALCKLGLMKQGMSEFEEAVKLDPHNENLKADLERIKQEICMNKQN